MSARRRGASNHLTLVSISPHERDALIGALRGPGRFALSVPSAIESNTVMNGSGR